jgi:uncharacterized membrane protein YfcA
MEAVPVWMPLAFAVVAFVYASVGFGGGSAYVAVLILTGVSHAVAAPVALVCNLVVSAGAIWHFRRGGHFDAPRVAPFLVASLPMAFVGGSISVDRHVFVALLGFCLVAAGLRLLVRSPRQRPRAVTPAAAWSVGVPLGAALGFLAGVVGIGGGIFLAPVLLLTGWATAKQAAAAAAVFVLLNSGAGLAGQLSKGAAIDAMVIPLFAAVLIGGQLGARAGAVHLPQPVVRRVLASIIVVVGGRLLWGLM